MLFLLGDPTCLLGEGASMGIALSPSMRDVKASAADSMSLNPLLVPASMHCQACTSAGGQAVPPATPQCVSFYNTLFCMGLPATSCCAGPPATCSGCGGGCR